MDHGFFAVYIPFVFTEKFLKQCFHFLTLWFFQTVLLCREIFSAGPLDVVIFSIQFSGSSWENLRAILSEQCPL